MRHPRRESAKRPSAVTCCLVLAYAAFPLTRPPGPGPPPALPLVLGAAAAEPVALQAAARAGCAAAPAAWARYGRQSLLLIGGGAPLGLARAVRRCLAGVGHDLLPIGVDSGLMPAAVYNSLGPDRRIYRVAVSYVAADGQISRSAAGAVWRWVLAGGGAWTTALRLSDWDETPAARAGFDARVARALGVGRAAAPGPRAPPAL